MKMLCQGLVGLIALMVANVAFATLIIPVSLTSPGGEGRDIGMVEADDTIYGLMLTPHLANLPPGVHGFHIREVGSCEHGGLDVGGHFDPDKTCRHRGPYRNGHMGDLPPLIVKANGRATLPVLAPRLKLANIGGRSLVVDLGGDNYSDIPRELGGGGVGVACGVVPYHG